MNHIKTTFIVAFVCVSGVEAVAAGDGGIKIPRNHHPLCIGIDSNEQNRLPGYVSRAAVFDRALSSDEIAKIVAAGQNAESPIPHPIISQQGLDPGWYVKTAPVGGTFEFPRGFTLETWFKPSSKNPGRLFDKIKAGGSDGFLFDTHPGDSLRLIVGKEVLSAPPGALKADAWQHVAATADAASGELRIYLDGKLIAQRPSDKRQTKATQNRP